MAKLIVEPTQMQAYETCPRLHNFRYNERYRSRKPNDKLYIGSTWGYMIDAYYAGRDMLEALDEYAEEEWQRINELTIPTVEQQEEFQKAIDLLKLLGYDYPAWAKKTDPDYWTNIIAIEQPFEVPIPETSYILAGRVDMLVADIWNRIWVVDHKTTSGGFWKPDEIKLNTQFQAYYWAMLQLLPDRHIGGVIYNGVRKTNPKRARKSVFGRVLVPFSERSFDEYTKKFQYLVNLIDMDQHAEYHRPQPGMHCNWMCPYRSVCLAMDSQSDYQTLLDEGFVVDDGGPNYLKED